MRERPLTGHSSRAFSAMKCLRHCYTANMGIVTPQVEEHSDAQVSTSCFFTESVPDHTIPSPKLFVDMVQCQWAQPGSVPAPSGLDKKLYSVDQVLEDLLKLPAIDVPLALLTSPRILPSDAVEGLKMEDKRAEFSTRKTHQATAWAIKSATAASFFARTSIIWLRQLQSRFPMDFCIFVITAPIFSTEPYPLVYHPPLAPSPSFWMPWPHI